MRNHARTALCALFIGCAVLLVTACGDKESDAVPARQWAKSVCSAVKPWSAEIRGLQEQARGKVGKGSDPAVAKAEFVRLFDNMSTATDDALRKVRDAGVPDVDNGRRVADQFVTALRAARDSFAKGKREVQRLDTADPAAFEDGVIEVGERMSEENDKAGRAFAEVSSPELDEAFNDVPECR